MNDKDITNPDIDIINTDIKDKIYFYFFEYFHNRNIDILQDYKSIPTNIYHASFIYIGDKLFKNKDNKYLYNRKSLINYDDVEYMEYIYNVYDELCKNYNIIGSYKMYCDLICMDVDTLFNWAKGATKNLTCKHLEFSKKVLKNRRELVQNKLTDTPVGIITLANNDQETGLEYNNKRQIEQAAAQAVSIDELKSKLIDMD